MSSDEFYTFDETLKLLNIDENKLKRLVSEGEIRAFRSGDQMMFRKTDVDRFVNEGLPIRDEPRPMSTDEEQLTDDLILDEGDDLDLTSARADRLAAEDNEGAAEAGAPAVEASPAPPEPPPPPPSPTTEDLLRETEGMRKVISDFQLRIQKLERWRQSIAAASGHSASGHS